mmetsp:Transcript_23711/g.74600  ORF Transcript_23711/g.74600 Transcript_23711/m.74600 type:complete len:252 (+) Transcript_23711:1202-1957(+)
MRSTPMGVVSLRSTRPSPSSVRDSTFPMGSSAAAMALMPSTSVWILASVSARRFKSGAARGGLRSFAACRSRALAWRIWATLAASAAATAESTLLRSSVESESSLRPPARAASACCRMLTRLAASSALRAMKGSGSRTNRVPSCSPQSTRSMVPALRPEHTHTAGTLAATARSAASILACMPPRPRVLLAPKVTLPAVSGPKTSMICALSSCGGRSKTPSTSVRMMSRSAWACAATSAARPSLSLNTSSGV